jgi:hypothetical protein
VFVVKQAVVCCEAGCGLCRLFECNSLLYIGKGFVVKHVNCSEFRDCGKLTKFLTQDKTPNLY